MVLGEELVEQLRYLNTLCVDLNQRRTYYKGKLEENALSEKIYLHYISEIEGILEELGKDEGLDCLLFFEHQLGSLKEQSSDIQLKLNSSSNISEMVFTKFEAILRDFDEPILETYVSELYKDEFEESSYIAVIFSDLTEFLKNNLNRFIMEEEDMVCLQMNLKN